PAFHEKELVMTPLRRRMTEDMILRNFAPGTIRQYVHCIARYARYFNTSPKDLGPEQVRLYLLHLVQGVTSPGATTAKFALPCSSSTAQPWVWIGSSRKSPAPRCPSESPS